MGSEHYCLRWNNHQSNLLGVFSQLLQDESLVDVTLACSEGAPIRAHKVVLSACSSYFQSLFLDHPEKHPIVILKDVRFSELQTLVEFMYKGEVNVQYCQLSALLKTAESLKVKGLAEMTNQNTTLREPEREPDRLRPHSQPSKSTCESPVDAALAEGASTSSSSASSANATSQSTVNIPTNSAVLTSASTSVAATTANSAKTTASGVHKREPSERCNSPPPTKRHQLTKHDNKNDDDDDDDDDDTPLPLDLYQRRIVEPLNEERSNERTSLAVAGSSTSNNIIIKTEQNRRSNTPSVSGTSHNTHNNGAEGRDTPLLNSPIERPSPCSIGAVEKIEDEDYDEDMDLDEDDGEGDNSSNEMGLNMKIHSHAAAAAVGLIVPSPLADIDSARSTPISASTSNAAGLMPSDLTQRSSTSRSVPATSNSGPTTSAAAIGSSGSGGGRRSPTTASSAIVGSSVGAGDTSGLGPVQSVPLSLKKEIDLSEDDNSSSRHMQPMRSASAGGGLSGTDIDYRTTHESETSDSPLISGVGSGSTTGGNATSSGAGGSRHSGGGVDTGGSGSGAHKQPQTPPPMYPCVYCNAAFPHQSKLTRHMLSHSLKSLEYRETTTHPLLHPHLLSHDLNMPTLSQQFAAYQINAAMSSGSTDPQDAAAVAAAAAAMELDFAAAVAAAGGCAALTGFAGCGTGRSGLDMDCSGVGGSNSGNGSTGGGGRSGGGGSSSGGNGGAGSSNLLLSGSGSSSSTSAAAAAASSSLALLSSASNDPNSAVLCKFCGKSFPDVPSLITHVPQHAGDRPFKCEYCGKAFKLRHHMKDHCRVHTGERPFRCPMCGKTFSRSTILKAHEKTHFPKYVRKFMPPSPVDTKDELPQ